MKYVTILLFCLFIISELIYSQSVTGRVVNTDGVGLADANLKLYIGFDSYTTISNFGGSFERLVSFFAKDNDMDIHEMEELLKNVQEDIKEQKYE